MVKIQSKKRICCNCGHNIRTTKDRRTVCNCDIDGHYIGYVECFEHWCPRWKRETKWDELKEKANGGLQ